MKYSDSPDRKSRRVTATSVKSIGRRLSELSKVRVTSAIFWGGLEPEPLKTTSIIRLERRDLTDISPKDQRMASTILDFPQPLGPTTAVIPGSKSNLLRSAKDLKPTISKCFRYISYPIFPLCCSLLGYPYNSL